MDQAKWIALHRVNKKIPLDYVLIDAGWCMCGDWLNENRNKFPKGIKWISKKIESLNLKPGIWIAPFLVEPKSKIAIDHPDWLVKKQGKLVEGLNLTPFDKYLPYKQYILDIKNPKALKYIENSIKHLICTCGYKLIKLDFLYGLYFNPHLSAKEANVFLHDFLGKIKEKYPSVYTIACGCPLLPAVGVVDSMRIGPDTSVTPFIKFLSLPVFSKNYLDTKVIPTILRRLWTKKYWNVDPDAFMCRKTSGFSPKQLLRFQKIIRLGGGNIFLGDDLTKLSNKRIERYIHPLFTK